MRKSPARTLRRRSVYWLTRCVAGVILWLPVHKAIRLGAALSVVAFWLLPKYRNRTIKNLAGAFGDELDAVQRRELAKEIFRNCGRSGVEFVLMRRWKRPDLEQRVRFLRMENLRAALDGGRGAIFLSAHFGNWELAGAATGKCLELSLGVVARAINNPWLNEELVQRRIEAGLEVFTRGRETRAILRHLHKGGILVILGDQDTRKGDGIFVPFFGKPAYTQRGPAWLAWRFKIPIVPGFVVRNEDRVTHTIHIEPPIEAPPEASEDEAIAYLVQSYTRTIEDYVRRYPDQWMWMHDRWRRQPTDARYAKAPVVGMDRDPGGRMGLRPSG